MPKATIQLIAAVAGTSLQKTYTRSGNTEIALEVTLPVGKAGTLKVRTDDNTGQVETSGAVASVIVNDKVDVFWSGGVRYGMNVDAVNGGSDTFDLDGGAGDVLPAQATAVVMTEQVVENIALDGDNAAVVAVIVEDTSGGSGAAHVDFQDAGNASIAEIDLVANVPQLYDIASGAANPFTGNPVTHLHASNGSSSNAVTLKVVAVVDN